MGNGTTVLFWEDIWCPVLLAQACPNLFLAASNTQASVWDIMHAPDLVSVLNLPLSPEAYDELSELLDQIGTVNYDALSQDKWTFMWGNDKYSSRKLYAMAFSSLPAPRTFSWVWKSQCTPRIKVLLWLTLVD